MFKIANELLKKMKEKIVGYKPSYANASIGNAVYYCSGSCSGSCEGDCRGSCSGDCYGSCYSHNR